MKLLTPRRALIAIGVVSFFVIAPLFIQKALSGKQEASFAFIIE
jgi:hypothetical protein